MRVSAWELSGSVRTACHCSSRALFSSPTSPNASRAPCRTALRAQSRVRVQGLEFRVCNRDFGRPRTVNFCVSAWELSGSVRTACHCSSRALFSSPTSPNASRAPCRSALRARVAINPKSQVVRRSNKRWKKAVHTADMLPYEVEKRWPGETTGGRRTGPVVSDRHPATRSGPS